MRASFMATATSCNLAKAARAPEATIRAASAPLEAGFTRSRIGAMIMIRREALAAASRPIARFPSAREEAVMRLLPQIEKRRAHRALSELSIPKEILLRLAEAAHLAPSCMNSQPWRIVTACGPEALAALKPALSKGNYWALKAPAISAFVTRLEWDARLDQGRDYAFFDLGMAAMSYQLQAVEEGLVAHPIAGFDPVAAKRALGIPEAAVLLTLIVLGFPGESAGLSEKHLESEKSARVRRPLDEVLSFEAWDPRLEPKAK